jgi:hypothetical protein
LIICALKDKIFPPISQEQSVLYDPGVEFEATLAVRERSADVLISCPLFGYRRRTYRICNKIVLDIMTGGAGVGRGSFEILDEQENAI